MDDDVFKAIADPTRRGLLDSLRASDGQSLSQLQTALPMTRFGVMKHLRVLEEAGLVVARRDGRRKLHYLNAVPIRLIHDRWVSRYAQPWAATLVGIKTDLEATHMHDTQPYAVVDGRGTITVFEIYIKTSPQRLWDAITSEEERRKYSFGVGTRSDWSRGSTYASTGPGGIDIASGVNLEVDPPHRLVQSFDAHWSEHVQAEGTSRVTWEIQPVGEDSCKLTVIHDRLAPHASSELFGGWPMILSGLKTLLETGSTLTTPGSLRYAQGSHSDS